MNGGREEGEGDDHRWMKNQQMQNTKMARMRDGWKGALKEAGIIMRCSSIPCHRAGKYRAERSAAVRCGAVRCGAVRLAAELASAVACSSRHGRLTPAQALCCFM